MDVNDDGDDGKSISNAHSIYDEVHTATLTSIPSYAYKKFTFTALIKNHLLKQIVEPSDERKKNSGLELRKGQYIIMTRRLMGGGAMKWKRTRTGTRIARYGRVNMDTDTVVHSTFRLCTNRRNYFNFRELQPANDDHLWDPRLSCRPDALHFLIRYNNFISGADTNTV